MPTFDWTDVEGAERYDFEVFYYISPSVIWKYPAYTVTSAYTLPIPLLPETYSWRVRVPALCSRWSKVWTFTVPTYYVYLPLALRTAE